MKNVTPGNDEVNGTIEGAIKFAEDMAERGEFGTAASNNMRGALRSLTGVLSESEPRTAAWVLEHIDDLGRRYAVKNNGKRETVLAYTKRARQLLEDYVRYLEDPLSFKGRAMPRQATTEEPTKRAPKAESRVTANAATSNATPPAGPRPWSTTLPTAQGPFVLQVPSDDNGAPDFSYKDLMRVTLSALAHARDFSPSNPRDARLYALLASPIADGE